MDDTLTQGVRYLVGFYASAANRAQYAIGTLGAALTKAPPPMVSTWHPNGMLDAEPQVLHGRLSLTDTTNWVLISDTVLAQGGERYLSIGNFHVDGESDTVRFNSELLPTCDSPATYANEDNAYYYIDDVFVYAIDSVPSGVGINEMGRKYGFKVYPNPSNGNLTLEYRLNEYEEGRLEVFDLMGKRILYKTLGEGRVLNFTLGNIASGLYSIRVSVGNDTKLIERISIISK